MTTALLGLPAKVQFQAYLDWNRVSLLLLSVNSCKHADGFWLLGRHSTRRRTKCKRWCSSSEVGHTEAVGNSVTYTGECLFSVWGDPVTPFKPRSRPGIATTWHSAPTLWLQHTVINNVVQSEQSQIQFGKLQRTLWTVNHKKLDLRGNLIWIQCTTVDVHMPIQSFGQNFNCQQSRSVNLLTNLTSTGPKKVPRFYTASLDEVWIWTTTPSPFPAGPESGAGTQTWKTSTVILVWDKALTGCTQGHGCTLEDAPVGSREGKKKCLLFTERWKCTMNILRHSRNQAVPQTLPRSRLSAESRDYKTMANIIETTNCL